MPAIMKTVLILSGVAAMEDQQALRGHSLPFPLQTLLVPRPRAAMSVNFDIVTGQYPYPTTHA